MNNNDILRQCHEAWLDPDNIPHEHFGYVQCDGCDDFMNPYDMDTCCVCNEIHCRAHMIEVDDGRVCDEWCLDKYLEVDDG